MLYLIKHNIPIVGTVLFGYVCAYLNIFDRRTMKFLANYIFFIALPCMLMFQFTKQPLGDVFNVNFILVFFMTSALLGGISVLIFKNLFRNRLAEQGIALITTAQINASYLGIPIFTLFFGTVSPIVMVLMVQTLLITPLVLGMIEYDFHQEAVRHHKHSPSVIRTLFLKEFPRILIRTPIILTSVLGVLVTYYHIKFPKPIDWTFSTIGDTTAPISLFLLGLSLHIDKISFRRGQFRQEVLTLITLKNFLHPLIAFCLGKYVFHLEPFWLLCICLLATMPSPRNASLFAQRFKLDVQRANTLMVLTTFIAFIVVNTLLYLFEQSPIYAPFFSR